MKKLFFVLFCLSVCLYVLNDYQVINIYSYLDNLSYRFPEVTENIIKILNAWNTGADKMFSVFTTWDSNVSFLANLGEKLSNLFIEPFKYIAVLCSGIWQIIFSILGLFGSLFGGNI